MDDNSEKYIKSTEQSDDALESGIQEDLQDDPAQQGSEQKIDLGNDSPPESLSLQIPKKETQSSTIEEVSCMEVAGTSGLSSKAKSSKKISSKERPRDSKRDDTSSTSTSFEAEHRIFSEISEKSPESSTVQMRQLLDNPQTTFYYLRDSSSSDDDSDVEKALRPFRVYKGRRTFSQCDSSDDSGLDSNVYDSEAKNKTSEDHADNLKNFVGAAKTSNVIESPTTSTSAHEVSKSDSEMPRTEVEKPKLSYTHTATKCQSVPLTDQKSENKPKKLSNKTSKKLKTKKKLKSVSTQTENIPDVMSNSGISSQNVESLNSDSSEKQSRERLDKTELSTIKAKFSVSSDNSESLASPVNILDSQINSNIKNEPLQSDRDKPTCLSPETSDSVSSSNVAVPPLEVEKHLGQTSCMTQELKLEVSQINPLDDASGSDALKNEGSEIHSAIENSSARKDDTKSCSVKDDLVCDIKLISNRTKVPLSPQKENLNLTGKSNVDLTDENLGASCLTNTEMSKLTSDPPPTTFKVPATPRAPKSRSKSEKHSSPKAAEKVEASAKKSLSFKSPQRPTDLNVGKRSAFYSFVPSRDQNNILRSYRSLPNVYSAPRKSENRRSVDLDIVRTAVRALFTDNPDPCTESTREPGDLSNTGLSAGGIETPPPEKELLNNSNKTLDKTRSENDIKIEVKNRNICRKLNFDSPQKGKTNADSTLQEGSSTELAEGMSGMYLYTVSCPSSDDDLCGRDSTPDRTPPVTAQAVDSPGISITEVSSDLENDAGATRECDRTADSKTFLSPGKDVGRSISPGKRKTEGLESALSSKSARKDVVSPRVSCEEQSKRLVEKERLSSELDSELKESVMQVKDNRTDQQQQGSPSFLSPPSFRHRNIISPFKRKAEELDIEPKTHSPDISPRRSIDTPKRSKLKLPAPIVEQPDGDEEEEK